MTASSLDAYRSHELSIQMRTSSGDTLSLNFQNAQSLSMNRSDDGSRREASFSFASMQAFSFEVNSNGITDQDQKEIDAFMKTAKPFIDKFMKELEEQNQTTPLNKVASDVIGAIGDLKNRPENVQNAAKSGIVDLFDRSIEPIKSHQKMLDEAQKLMEKILRGFEKSFEPVYA